MKVKELIDYGTYLTKGMEIKDGLG